MSTLYLIRHGQASFGADDYDVLSELGIDQSRHLGQYLAGRGVALDAIYSGPAKRQIDTARHLRDAAKAAGQDYPDSGIVDEFDEYPAFALFKRWLPILRESDDEIRAAFARASTGQDVGRLYTLISQKWARGELDSDDLETFRGFNERVTRGLTDVMSRQGRKKSVAVVTSGGPISLAMRIALNLAPDVTLRVAWVIANSSMTEFRYRDDELTLTGFNHHPHLVTRELVSYR